MVVIFSDGDLEEWYTTAKAPKKGRYKKYSRDAEFSNAFINTLNSLHQLHIISDARNLSRLHYEKLSENLSGKSSVRIMNGRKERLIFIETTDGLKIEVLELDMTHYGSK